MGACSSHENAAAAENYDNYSQHSQWDNSNWDEHASQPVTEYEDYPDTYVSGYGDYTGYSEANSKALMSAYSNALTATDAAYYSESVHAQVTTTVTMSAAVNKTRFWKVQGRRQKPPAVPVVRRRTPFLPRPRPHNPTTSEDSLVTVTATPSHGFLLAGKAYKMHVLVKIRTATLPRRMRDSRSGFELVLLLDTSSSMRAKLPKAKEAINAVLDMATERDVIHLVEYNTDTKVVFSNATVNSSTVDDLKGQVNSMKVSGCTNIEKALDAAAECLTNSGLSQQIFLFSDGQPTSGTKAAKQLGEKAASIAQSYNCGFTCFGLGDTYGEGVMVAISEAGSGQTYHLKTENDIPVHTASALKGLTHPAATFAELALGGSHLRPAAAVRQQQMQKPFEGQKNFAKVKSAMGKEYSGWGMVNLNTLREDDSVEVLVELSVPAMSPPLRPTAKHVTEWELSYWDPTGVGHALRGDVVLPVTANRNAWLKSENAKVASAIEIEEVGKIARLVAEKVESKKDNEAIGLQRQALAKLNKCKHKRRRVKPLKAAMQSQLEEMERNKKSGRSWNRAGYAKSSRYHSRITAQASGAMYSMA